MADLNRELQEYLTRSKTGGTGTSADPPAAPADLESGDAAPAPGRWFNPRSWSWPGLSSGSGSGSWTPWWAQPDPLLPGLGARERLACAAGCALLSALSFGLSAAYAPLLLLHARKFALLWSLGSLFAVLAAAVLRGPSRFAAGLCGSPVAALYLVALGGTLFAALGMRSSALTALGAAAQAGCAFALLPGGATALKLLWGLAAAAVKRTVKGRTLPV